MNNLDFRTGNKELNYVVNEALGSYYKKYISEPRLGIRDFYDTSDKLAFVYEEYRKTRDDGSPFEEYEILDYIPEDTLKILEDQVNTHLLSLTDKKLQHEEKISILRKGISALNITFKDGTSPFEQSSHDQEKYFSKILTLLSKGGLNQLTVDSKGNKSYLFIEKLIEDQERLGISDDEQKIHEYIKYIDEQTRINDKLKLLKSYRTKLTHKGFNYLLWRLDGGREKKNIQAIQTFNVDIDSIIEQSIGRGKTLHKTQYSYLKKAYQEVYGLSKHTANQTSYIMQKDYLAYEEPISDRQLKRLLEKRETV